MRCGCGTDLSEGPCLPCAKPAATEWICAKCNGPRSKLYSSKTKLCRVCWLATDAQRDKWKAMLGTNLDWSSDPCSKCGKHPLSYQNRSGICRDCARGVPFEARKRRGKESVDAAMR